MKYFVRRVSFCSEHSVKYFVGKISTSRGGRSLNKGRGRIIIYVATRVGPVRLAPGVVPTRAGPVESSMFMLVATRAWPVESSMNRIRSSTALADYGYGPCPCWLSWYGR